MMLHVFCSMLLGVAVAAPDTRWFDSKTVSRNSTFHPGLQLDLAPYSTTFEYFKKTYKKVYTEGEESARRGIFEENAKFIEEHNSLYLNGVKSYYLAINQFADMTVEEFNQKMKGFKQVYRSRSGHSTFLAPNNLVLPSKVDWREKGYVTGVKNQGACGSCWAFSATGSIEGQHFRQTGKLVSLSEEQLMDCSDSFGDHGCNGGLMDNAFEYGSRYGLESEKEYQYKGETGTCKYKASKVVANITGYTDIESGSESALQKAVASVGPISVAIDASHSSFQMYSGGVYDESECSSSQLDHGVLAVGYGVDGVWDRKYYWLVKNSWGVDWGTNGYIMMSRNKDNQCGIATEASYPLV